MIDASVVESNEREREAINYYLKLKAKYSGKYSFEMQHVTGSKNSFGLTNRQITDYIPSGESGNIGQALKFNNQLLFIKNNDQFVSVLDHMVENTEPARNLKEAFINGSSQYLLRNIQARSVIKTVGEGYSSSTITLTGLPAGMLLIIPKKLPSQLTTTATVDSNTTNESLQVTTMKEGSDLKTGCSIDILVDGELAYSYGLPCLPTEFSDSNSPQFNKVSLLGRSVAYQIYDTTGRSVSINLPLHEELVWNRGSSEVGGTDYDYIHRLVRVIESAAYPEYDSKGRVYPPEIVLTLGKALKIRGVLNSCNSSWSGPWNYEGGQPSTMRTCTLSLGIEETTGPYSMSQIAQLGGVRP